MRRRKLSDDKEPDKTVAEKDTIDELVSAGNEIEFLYEDQEYDAGKEKQKVEQLENLLMNAITICRDKILLFRILR